MRSDAIPSSHNQMPPPAAAAGADRVATSAGDWPFVAPVPDLPPEPPPGVLDLGFARAVRGRMAALADERALLVHLRAVPREWVACLGVAACERDPGPWLAYGRWQDRMKLSDTGE